MPSPIQLNAGQVFAKDFRVVRPLRSGGMGSVYIVQQMSTGAERALKLMHRELVADPRQRARFEQEAKIGASIRSDHVVKVIGAGIDEEWGLPYLVMELLEGSELEEMIATRGPLPPQEVALIFSQLCHALAAAHVAGVVHRDLKPENIFIATSQRADVPFTVKILDFGIAKVVAEAKTSAPTQSLGTPLYMSPEQGNLRTKIVPATDVWALGLIAFRALTGRQFWRAANDDGGSIEMIMAELLVYEIPLASMRAVELGIAPLPPGFDEWLATCLMRDPAARFPTAAEAWRGLSPILGAAPAGGRTDGPYGAGATVLHTPTGSGGIPPVMTYGAGGTVAATGPYASGAYPPSPYPTASSGGTQLHYTPPPGQALLYATAPGAVFPTRVPVLSPPKTRGFAIAVAAFVFLGTVGVGTFLLLHSFKDSSTTYCAELINRYMVPECTTEVPASAQKHRTLTQRISKKAGRVALIEHVNGVGRLVDDDHGYASEEYVYGASRWPKEIIFKNHLGVVQQRRLISDDGTHIAFVDAFGDPKPLKDTHAIGSIHALDDKGLDAEEKYLNALGKPTYSAQRVYGYKFKHDAQGRTISVMGVDPSDAPMRTSDWMASVTKTFDPRGWEKAGQFQDENGVPILNKTGVSGFDEDFDEFGNATMQRNLSVDMRPVPTKQGSAEVANEFDEHGQPTKVTYLDATGKPTLSSQGFAGWTSKFDDHGNTVETAFFDAEGKPAVTADGAAKITCTFDDRDLRIGMAYWGLLGEPVAASEGTASSTSKYDASGNLTERHYFGIDGKPARNASWIATTKWTFDDHNRIIMVVYLDPGGAPTVSSEGFAKETIKYDAHGNPLETAYFDASGAPAGGPNGVAREVRAFDELGDVIAETFLDEQGRPVRANDTFASMKAKYDENGLRTDVEYFGLDGTRALAGESASEHEARDRFGNIVVTDERGLDGAPLKPVARQKYEYDNRDLAVVVSYLGPDGAPAVKDGTAGYRRKYDERGDLVEERPIGVDGKPLVVDGVCGYDAKFDVLGRMSEKTNTGPSGEAVLSKAKWAKLRNHYDPYGRAIETAYLGLSDEPVTTTDGYSILRAEYDSMGRQTTIRAFDTSGKPAQLAPKNYGRLFEYDERGNRIKESYFGADGKVSTKGFLICLYQFDERDRPTEMKFLRDDGEPGVNNTNVSFVRYKNDDLGRRIEEAAFDKDGKPTGDDNGAMVRRYKYDHRGRRIEDACFDASGVLTNNKQGWATKRFVFGDNGKLQKTILSSATGFVINTIDTSVHK